MANGTIYSDGTVWCRVAQWESVHVVTNGTEYGVGYQGFNVDINHKLYVRIANYDAIVFERDGLVTREEPSTLTVLDGSTKFWDEA